MCPWPRFAAPDTYLETIVLTSQSPHRPNSRLAAALRGLALMCAVAALTGLEGCSNSASPTLPIPPPSALSTPPDADGFVTIQGTAAVEGAIVSAFNERIGEGVIGEANDLGEFELRLRAAGGDPIAIWQTVGSDRGEILTVLVPDP